MNKKKLTIALSVALIALLAIGGTLAWLADKSGPVTNTFTYGDVNIDLAESDTNLDGDNDPATNTYKMVPGSDIKKDPKVTIKTNSEKCYVFVKVEEENNVAGTNKKFFTYAIDSAWTRLESVTDAVVFYKVENATTTDVTYSVLEGDKVTVDSSVTKSELNNIGTNYPQLIFTAYAVQFDNVDSAADAWNIAKDL